MSSPAPGAARTQGSVARPGAQENPFLAARDEFANAFGDLARGKRNWQLMAFAAMGVLALVTAGYIDLARSARVVPYLVQVDRLGQLLSVGTADELKRPDARLIASELARFVRAIRTVLPAQAAAAQAELMRRSYAFLAPQAAAFLNDYFSRPEHDPRLLGARLARQVDVAGVLKIPGSDVWRVQWTETERSSEPAGDVRTTAWEGYLTVKLVPPRTAEAIEENPLGLSITTVSWTEVAESTPAAPAAAVAPLLPTAPVAPAAPARVDAPPAGGLAPSDTNPE